MVTNYLRTKIFEEDQKLFEQRFRDRVSPTKMTIYKNVKKYKSEESSLNPNKHRLCHRRAKLTQENANLIKEKIIEDPRISARKNCYAFNRITKHELKWHP